MSTSGPMACIATPVSRMSVRAYSSSWVLIHSATRNYLPSPMATVNALNPGKRFFWTCDLAGLRKPPRSRCAMGRWASRPPRRRSGQRRVYSAAGSTKQEMSWTSFPQLSRRKPKGCSTISTSLPPERRP